MKTQSAFLWTLLIGFSSSNSMASTNEDLQYVPTSQIYFAADQLLPARQLRTDLGEKELVREQRILWDTMSLFLDRQQDRGVDFRQRQDQGQAPKNESHVPRIFHTKSHGCVQGRFQVSSTWLQDPHAKYLNQSFIKAALQDPKNSKGGYPVVMRFSTSKDELSSDDRVNGRRGVGIKIFGLGEKLGDQYTLEYQNEPTLDFNLVNNETFFLRDSLENLAFSKVFFAAQTPQHPTDTTLGKLRNTLDMMLGMLTQTHPSLKGKTGTNSIFKSEAPLDTILLRIKEKKGVDAVQTWVNNPLKAQYWSQVPFALGEYGSALSVPVKVSVAPCSGTEYKQPTEHNGIRKELYSSLKAQPGCFDLMVQIGFNKKALPQSSNRFLNVEDAMELWDSNEAPFIKVGKIHIPQQNENQEFNVTCEQKGFNLGSLPKDFQPIGSIGRARRLSYLVTQIHRYFSILKQTKEQMIQKNPSFSEDQIFSEMKSKFKTVMSARLVDLYRASEPQMNRFIFPSLVVPDLNWNQGPVDVMGAIFAGASGRDELFKSRLHSLVEAQDLTGADCRAPEVQLYRTYDGTCNDLKFTFAGSAGTPFGLNTNPQFLKQEKFALSGEKLPSAEVVANELLVRKSTATEHTQNLKTLNLLAGAWLQFMIHDWFNHKDASRGPGISHRGGEIRNDTSLEWKAKHPGLKPVVNELTHWWDGSQIYGSSTERALSLRTGQGAGAFMKMDGDVLPVENRHGQILPLTGFNNNLWVGLELLHTVFTREHNSIASELSQQYGTTIEKMQNPITIEEKQLAEKIYQQARLINAALMVKIQTVEWTPKLLDNVNAQIALSANYCGLKSFITKEAFEANFEDVCSQKTLTPSAAGQWQQKLHQWIGDVLLKYYKKKSPEESDFDRSAKTDYILNGIMGSRYTQNFGVPFSLTEEFVSVYRIHQMLQDQFSIFSFDNQVLEKATLMGSSNMGGHEMMKKYGGDVMGLAMGANLAGALSLRNFPAALAQLPLPGFRTQSGQEGQVINLAALEVQRDRLRLPIGFNGLRKSLGLRPFRSFYELLPEKWNRLGQDENREIRNKLMEVYKGKIDAVDIQVGLMAEGDRPEGYAISQTAFQVFLFMTPRRIMTDRFYTKDFRSEIYSEWGLSHIKQNSLRTILMRHYPKLTPLLMGVKNAFEPWTTTH